MAEQRSYRQSQQSNRMTVSPNEQQQSPVRAISRTPTADRRLLRALTGTPDEDQLSDNPTPKLNPSHLQAPSYQRQRPQQASKNSYRQDNDPETSGFSQQSEPLTESNNDRGVSGTTQAGKERTVIRLPSTASNEIKGVCELLV